MEWIRLRRRSVNSEEEISEIHDLIVNVYESMDDQARAVLLSLSKIVQGDEGSLAIEDKIKAIVAMGHSLCCSMFWTIKIQSAAELIRASCVAHTQVKNATQLYAISLVRALSHHDLRMRLAAMIAIAETAIDNLTFQMKVSSRGKICSLVDRVSVERS